MSRDLLNPYIGTLNLSLIEAMKKIDDNAKGIIYIVDETDKLCGSLTDGDIRRWILKTGQLECCVGDIIFRNTKYLFEEDTEKCNEYMKEKKLNSIPILNDKFQIVNIVFNNELIKTEKNENARKLDKIPVIIMAGGKGTRLYPYTKILPKPLIPVGDIPILERILDRFYEYGINEFYLTVNYKKEMIKSYFMESTHPYFLKYIEETEPLGTAGSIRLITERFKSPAIITNCDTLIEADYGEVMGYHHVSGNDMTIVASLKNTVIQYGVLHTKEQGIVTSMEEKPQLSYFINTGMYIVNPEFLDWIPEGRIFHMTDLAELMIKEEKQVGIYPINENSFLDMGEFEEMKKMEERIERGKM